eukprot:822020-Prorocentrum_minimum.AAC.1
MGSSPPALRPTPRARQSRKRPPSDRPRRSTRTCRRHPVYPSTSDVNMSTGWVPLVAAPPS